MKAIVFDGKRLSVENIPVPSTRSGEALIKVLVGGICKTDIEICKGYMGFRGVLGHEFVGIVEDCEKASLIGKRVVGEINCPCYQCDFCKKGEYKHCPNRTVLGIYNRDGVFAEYTVLPIANLHLIPDTLSNNVAVFTEPLAACYRVLEQVQIKPYYMIVVLGDGKMGQLLSQVFHSLPVRLVCIGKYEHKLGFLRELGVECYKYDEVDLPSKADIVVDATGSSEGLKFAMEIVKPKGTIVMKSTVADSFNINLSKIVVDEINVLGSRCGPFEPAIKALALGKIKTEYLVSGIYSIDDSLEAFRKAVEKETFKVLIKFA